MNKFRTYNEITNQMEESFELDNNFDCHSGWLENSVLIRYTGVNDIFKKEVYEGDIVVSSTHKNFPYKRKCVIKIRPLGLYLSPLDNTVGDYLLNFQYQSLEIIGNIYHKTDNQHACTGA